MGPSESNIFADSGIADPDLQLVKSSLVIEIRQLLAEQQLSQTQAAKRLGMSQADLSKLLRGKLRNCSLERIMRILNRLGRSVMIYTQSPYPDDIPKIICRSPLPWGRHVRPPQRDLS